MANSITKGSITQEASDRLIEAATAKAEEMGVPMCISVVDESGNLKAFRRMDGAALLSIDIATNKAYTAVSFGMPSHGWYDFIKNDPPLLHGIVHTPRLVVFGGGYPVSENDQIIGAIGVSGGHYEQDMAVAEAALAALAG
ncbi:GlcG/HbpS family heme-binding protein [Pelagerythrobacter aerophilus]|uniref:Heme-binding protein n=1 Tax=Pelagerythrobacter aerophilus TaxID=2306995 RepID=A0A418NED7_9SPHN|nr:heme-binding protein [Pelagerythrobacter aerophilus]RIV75580.1 heme-binding protein [Pelagerythrobacter aerophilus]